MVNVPPKGGTASNVITNRSKKLETAINTHINHLTQLKQTGRNTNIGFRNKDKKIIDSQRRMNMNVADS